MSQKRLLVRNGNFIAFMDFEATMEQSVVCGIAETILAEMETTEKSMACPSPNISTWSVTNQGVKYIVDVIYAFTVSQVIDDNIDEEEIELAQPGFCVFETNAIPNAIKAMLTESIEKRYFISK